MSDSEGPPEKGKPPGDANQPGRPKTETLYLRASQRVQVQEDVARLEREQDFLLEKSRAEPNRCHWLVMAAVNVWAARSRLADQLLPARFRRWRT